MMMWDGRYSSRSALWWRTSVFFKLNSSPKSWASFAKQVLQGSFGVGNERSVVSVNVSTEQLLKCFCVGMQSEVKQTAVNTVADIYSNVIIKVFCDLFKHHAEKDAEQSRCQNTTLFHTVDDGERSREVTVQPNLAALVFLQLDNQAEVLWEAAKALHDHPQSLQIAFDTVIRSALCQMLWSGLQTLHTVLCSASCIFLE